MGITWKKLRTKVILYTKRCFKLFVLLLATYFSIVLIGLMPVNNSFESPENGIEIRVTSSSVHADIIVPLTGSVIDWRTVFSGETFNGGTDFATHVAFGWGDRGFFIETPGWSDLKLSTAAKELLIPSQSCLHVAITRAGHQSQSSRSVKLSEEQYARLVEFIRMSFRTNKAGEIVQIPEASYGTNDAFFEANGRYHCLNTCNSWVGRGLKQSGVRAPWLTPLSKTPMLYLPTGSE